MTTLSFVNASKSYGDLVAIHPVTAEVPDAAWWIVVGPNGSGKTTLLQLATGLQAPTSGQVWVDEDAAGSVGARGATSYLADSPAFYSDLSVSEHFDYLAGLYEDDAVADRGHEVMAAFELTDRVEDLPDTFSRGMKQKTAIAFALARPSTILLLDEPTRGLDTAGAATMVRILEERNAAGSTVLIVTHEPERFVTPNAMEWPVYRGEFEQPRPMT